MSTILKVENLHVKNKDIKILHDISFNIKKGEVLGIVGESGCGKSTLIRALTQMLENNEKIVEGNISFKDTNLLAMSSKEMRKLKGNEIALVFQNPGTTLNPIRKIGKQFVEALKSHIKISKKEALKRAEVMLEKVNLKDTKCILNSYPFELSGGMKQRVAIALAMILEPELLVADEPTSALDVSVQAQVLELLLKMKEEFNISYIFITHDLALLSSFCDKVLVMNNGNIVEEGPVNNVINNPKSEYTKLLLNSILNI